MTSIKDYELLGDSLVSAFYSDMASFKAAKGDNKDFELYLKWVEIQKLERINAQLSKIVSLKEHGQH
ncbi:MAG: hypothetical protein KF744_08000 [Taibaiella sp.]|nr:hypothetical protein [Taibaiella sp.]